MLNHFQQANLNPNRRTGGKRISIKATTGWLLLMASFVLTSGCYPDWPEHSGTAQVEGEVFLDGFPLNKANVVFLPSMLKSKSGKLTMLAYGKCDARGKFEMAYQDGSPDITAGKYYVLISLVDTESAKKDGNLYVPNQENKPNLILFNQMLAAAESSPVPPAELRELVDRHQIVPALYNRQSNLTYEVVASPGIVRTKFDLSTVDPLLRKH